MTVSAPKKPTKRTSGSRPKPTSSGRRLVLDESSVPAASAVSIREYLDEIWLAKGLSDNTLAAYRRDLVALADFLAPTALLDAKAEELFRYLGERFEAGYASRSAARSLSCVRGFYKHAQAQGRIELDPSAQLAQPKLARRDVPGWP